MKGLLNWLEHSFSPRMNKINSNLWIVALKDSIMQILPFIFLGSLFSMLSILNEIFSGWPDFHGLYSWTMGMISLFVAFLIPFNLMERLHATKQRLIAGMAGLVLFLITVSPAVIDAGKPGFKNEALGAGGMFAAIITGLITGWVMKIFASFTFFKNSSAIPDFVPNWFDAMLPVAIVVVFGWALIDVIGVDLFRGIQAVFSPVADIIQTPYGFALMMFLSCFIYSMGISVWVLSPVLLPAMYAAMAENVAGHADHLVTYSSVYSTYLWIGGVGATLPLVLLMLRAKSTRLRALGKAGLAPLVFNINEPVIFGAVAWNPTLMVPLWLQGIILPLLLWLLTKVIPLGPIPDKQFDLWYMPYPISTWLSTGSFSAVLVALIVFLVSGAIWSPFLRVYDRQLVKQAEAEAQKAATATEATDPEAKSTETGRTTTVRKVKRKRPPMNTPAPDHGASPRTDPTKD